MKIKGVRPHFVIYVPLVVVYKRGCAQIKEDRLRIFDIDYKKRWYMCKVRVLDDF